MAPERAHGSAAAAAAGWKQWSMPVLILAVATVLRIVGLDKSLWFDEASSYAQASGEDFWATMRNYDHPPLYFALLRFGLGVSESFAALRLFSVACGLAVVAVFCRFPSTPRPAALLAALLIGVLPAFVVSSQEMRHYALLHAALVVALAAAWRVIHEPKSTLSLAVLASTLVVAACTHLIAVFFILALGSVVMCRLRHEPATVSLRTAAAFLPSVVVVLFFKFGFLLQADKSTDYWWMPPVGPGPLLYVIRDNAGFAALQWVADACDHSIAGTGTGVLFAAVVVGAAMLWAAWGHANISARSLLAVALLYWSALIAYSWFAVPIIWSRTMLPGMLPFVIGLAIGIWTNPNRQLKVTGCIAIMAFAAAMILPRWRGPHDVPVEDLRSLAATLQHNIQPIDICVFIGDADIAVRPYWRTLPRRAHVKLALTQSTAATALSLDEALAGKAPGAAVLVTYRDDYYLSRNRPVVDAALAGLAVRMGPATALWNRDRYHVLKFEAARRVDTW